MEEIKRCNWAEKDEILKKYHDEVWGRPCYDDTKLFKMLMLEIFQAGLSWETILKKEENFNKAFDNFDIEKIKDYDEDKIQELLLDEGIIRNEKKIRAIIDNAKLFVEVQKKYGSFSKFIWSYSFDTPIINPWSEENEVPNNNPLSDKITEDMKNLGFKFIGSTIIYSFMQAIGMINDHILSCDFKYID